jgi:hypothetical protein
MALLIRIAIQALTFAYLLPIIHGVNFHGGFGTAFILAVFFSLMLWAVEALAAALAAVWTIASFGLALLFIVPLWIFGFWILPAIALLAVSDLMPSALTVTGWIPAALGGLVLLVVGMLTGGLTSFNSTVTRSTTASA